MDPEVAELMRQLELPDVSDGGDTEAPPLAGVLRKRPQRKSKNLLNPASLESESPDIIPAVVAYEPIKLDVPAWGAESATPEPDEAANGEAAKNASAGSTPTRAPVAVKSAEFFFEDADELDAEDLQEVYDKTQPPVAKQRPQTAPTKPPPPRKPPPTPPQRVVKEGEIVLTQEAIDDMLAGGKADEARDLDANSIPDSNWFGQVFNEDYFRTLPQNLHQQTLREVDFVVDRLGVEPGGRVLDLCCGFGRHTMLMAKRGFDMVGLDLSLTLLQKALAEAQRRGLSIKFVHGDMRKLSFQSVFDGIFNVQTSFGYFNDQTNFRVLQGILRALKPGGRFLIETINRDFVCEDLPMRIWWEGTECLILEEVDYDFKVGVLKVKRSFVFEDTSRDPWEQNISIRLYAPHELRQLLTRAGFDFVELSGDYALPGAFFGGTSRRSIIVAERPVD